ncbi:tonB-system energizer ExbB [Rhodopseudomonas sp. BR0M22]|uniref:tonB-system energizer ExbB n=1 Tax=Rhodopseudomonas sp. BR0M22 TaxID=2269369 RepID=UPI0013DFA69F|nr:tonB-system energizer ExbB [Rhodopseudomonas sp. BR0M22]NEW92016.1 tonB-system energizer ExbB [Rhodopseudomonas sp. BR0M22]
MTAVRRISIWASLALIGALLVCAPDAAAQQPGPVPAPSAPTSVTSPESPSVAPAAVPAGEGGGSVARIPPKSDRHSGLPHDLSPVGMFLAADWVVKAVMIALLLASFLSWTICVAKAVEVACANARAKRAFRIVDQSLDLDEAVHRLSKRGGPAVFMVRSASDELHRSLPVLAYAGETGLKDRVVSRLARIEAQAGRRLMRGTGLLATVGAVSPFVGLFGTVWGIMNAFIGISQSHTTNLAVVAPGIAEALLATAFGLVAAMPAVVIYNVFARAISGYRQILADAAAGVERLISLDLDFRKIPDERRTSSSMLAAE